MKRASKPLSIIMIRGGSESCTGHGSASRLPVPEFLAFISGTPVSRNSWQTGVFVVPKHFGIRGII